MPGSGLHYDSLSTPRSILSRTPVDWANEQRHTMIWGYIFMASCLSLAALALGLLTREVFAEKKRNVERDAREAAYVLAQYPYS